MFEKYHLLNSEVLYSKDTITKTNQSDIELLTQRAAHNQRKRIRLCAHASPADRLHEMLIVHEQGAYVRPHKHPGKSESTHIIEGLVDVVVFDDNGQIESVIRMGDYASGRTFYYRMSIPVFHTLIIRSEVIVFHETTNGPFNRADTIFAPWSPEENDSAGCALFMGKLTLAVENFLNMEANKS